MARKRDEARRRDAGRRDAFQERHAAHERERATAAAAGTRSADVIPWLRQLGFRADEARRAAQACDAIPDASLDERVRHALRTLAPAGARRCEVGPSGPA